MHPEFLVTGVTGSVGIEWLRIALARAQQVPMCFLMRSTSEDNLASRWADILKLASDGKKAPSDVPHLTPVSGDVTDPKLGLSDRHRAQIAANVHTIFHCAAEVSFGASLIRTRKVNVQGTQHVINLALECAKLQKFVHVSTAFVAGRRKGLILETELDHDAGFVNPYEHSKYEAEKLVHQYEGRLPISIYRLPLLMGRSTDGYVHEQTAIHQLIGAAFFGLTPVVRGTLEDVVDMLPNDYAAEGIWALMDQFVPQVTYHITSGKNAVPAHLWWGLTAELFYQFSPQWRAGAYEFPRLVNEEEFNAYLQTEAVQKNRKLLRMIRLMGTCTDHLVLSQIFDNTLTKKVFAKAPPAFESYYPKVVQYCVEHLWKQEDAH